MPGSKKYPIIHSLLPAKEFYTRENAGAVAMVTADMVLASKHGMDNVVFGRYSDHAPLTKNYVPLKPARGLLFGQNIGMAKAYLNHLDRTEVKPDWVEVHGRCQVAAYIMKKRPDLNVVLVLHNDPRDMKGAKSIAERRQLANNLSGVFAVSNYLITCFNDGLNPQEYKDLVQAVTPLGIDMRHKKCPEKKKHIVIIGRMVPEKGILEAAQALAKILPKYPDWSARFIGAKGFTESDQSAYEKAVAKTLLPCGDQAKALGFLPLDEVQKEQDDAAIAIVPSQWQEPAGRVVLEAMVSGAALITTRRGGIPEYAENRALILDDPDADHLAEAIEDLISNPALRSDFQQMAWQDYPFNRANLGHCIDSARAKL